jgi:hypothetical protein
MTRPRVLLLAWTLLLAATPAYAQQPPAESELQALEAEPDAAESDAPAEETTSQPVETEPQADTELQPDAPDSQAPAAESESLSSRPVSLQAAAGLGFGTLSFTRPTREGEQVLNETPFAATELMLRATAWPAEAFSLEVLAAYQTSLGMILQTAPLFALPQNVSVRAQRGELSLGPTFRLGDSGSAFALALPAGFAFQTLTAEAHQYDLPSYAVGGPQLRGELVVKLGELVQLRVGPELQWIVLIGSSLREQSACCQGIALGGQGALQASFGPHLSVSLAYRESHSFLPVPATRFLQTQRFLTARIAGGL